MRRSQSLRQPIRCHATSALSIIVGSAYIPLCGDPHNGMSRRTSSSDSDSRSRLALRGRPMGFDLGAERLPAVRCNLSRYRSS